MEKSWADQFSNERDKQQPQLSSPLVRRWKKRLDQTTMDHSNNMNNKNNDAGDQYTTTFLTTYRYLWEPEELLALLVKK